MAYKGSVKSKEKVNMYSMRRTKGFHAPHATPYEI